MAESLSRPRNTAPSARNNRAPAIKYSAISRLFRPRKFVRIHCFPRGPQIARFARPEKPPAAALTISTPSPAAPNPQRRFPQRITATRFISSLLLKSVTHFTPEWSFSNFFSSSITCVETFLSLYPHFFATLNRTQLFPFKLTLFSFLRTTRMSATSERRTVPASSVTATGSSSKSRMV